MRIGTLCVSFGPCWGGSLGAEGSNFGRVKRGRAGVESGVAILPVAARMERCSSNTA